MWRWAGVIVAMVLAAGAAALYGLAHGWFGERRGAGEIEGAGLAAAVVEARVASRRPDGGARQILFGDLHVHTTFSLDAFGLSLPLLQGEGAHPAADACDFARYCSALDFWSINDHVEGMTPAQWRETKRSVRACNAKAGDPANPDMVTFLGWEWSQIGSTPENHYGHKNVIFLDTEEDKVPVRPIGATPLPGTLSQYAITGLWRPRQAIYTGIVAPGGRRQDYLDFVRFLADRAALTRCPAGVPVRSLPEDCLELAATPKELFAKLDDWGFPSLVIPHGTTWGFYTPLGTAFDKQMKDGQHDPNRQTLFEIFSGHGNSEEYRDYRGVKFDAGGKAYCPKPDGNHLPGCWRAGEIIKARCLNTGEAQAECDLRAVEARRNYVAAGVTGFRTVPGARPEDWLDSGQCRDCFLPAFNYRPGNSGQYALAIANFDDPANPRRFRFGFIGSSDNHSARPGTGYKEINRFIQTEGGGPARPGMVNDPERHRGDATATRSVAFDRHNMRLTGFDLVDVERQASFFMLGGLVAVHADGRGRQDIWRALQRREVYATSGDRILLWFSLEEPGGGAAPMGAAVTRAAAPQFTVKALGAYRQKPGCPNHAVNGLSPERLNRLCRGECYNPSDERRRITHIEVVRIRPQVRPDEPVAALIEDPWRRFSCPAGGGGCAVTFDDPDFASTGRDTVYYVRAVQEPTPTVNAGQLRCTYDEAGRCIKVNPCYKDYRTDRNDDCLAQSAERAWSSPIFVDYRAPAPNP